MRRRLAVVLLVAVAGLGTMLSSGCGFAPFAKGSADPQELAEKANVVILDQGTAENRYAGGTTASWYAVGREGSDEVKAVVSVLQFESERDRNEAYRQIMYRMGRGLPSAVVYTTGDAVVQVSRMGDYGTVKDLNEALLDAGAQ
jgi:hypothetical protein